MPSNSTRPVNLALTTMVFPPMAISSILHRLSGVALFLFLPIILYFLSLSLQDETTFTDLHLWLATPYCKAFLWLYTSAAWYHAIAGIRHLIMDAGFGEGLTAGRYSAIAVIGLGVVGALALGVLIW